MDTLISLRLPSETVEMIDRIAEREQRSRGFMVRVALEQYLAEQAKNQPKPKARKKPQKDSLTPA